MTNIEKLKKAVELQKQAQALYADVVPQDKEFIFCLHDHYDVPTFSAWRFADATECALRLSVDKDVVIADLGSYSLEDCQKVAKILQDSLDS